MRSRAWVAVTVALAVLLVGALLAQEQPRRGMGRGRWQEMSEEERAQRRKERQEQRLSRLKERLGVSDDEWAVLSEPITALLALSGEQFAASQKLREAVGAEETTTEQLKKALDEYRKARKDIAARRAKLQAQLKALVSLRQEAMLVLEGILE